jgi:hypothetical protein
MGFQDKQLTQSLSANGNLSLTEKWKITAKSGHDFVAKGLYTIIGITSDLDLN